MFATLALIGQMEGFEVIPTNVFYFARDPKIRRCDGTFLRSTDIDNKIKSTAITRMSQREGHLKTNHAMVCTSHPFIKNLSLGKGIEEGMNHRRAGDGFIVRGDSFYDAFFNENLTQTGPEAKITPSRAAWEGGNVTMATNLQGRVKVLIGEDLLTITQHVLRLAGYFKFEEETFAHTEETLCTFYKLGDDLNEMYKKQDFPKLVIKHKPQLSDDEVLATGHEMNAMSLIKKFEPEVTEELRKITGDYLGQRSFVSNILWPNELKVDSADIHVLKQAASHLNVFLKPGPRGSFFLQSFNKTVHLLEEIKVHAKTLELTSKDLEILETLLSNANLLAKDLGPLYQKIQAQITEAGFKIIETPGIFFGKEGGKEISVNFINALSGWSPVTKRYYYICLGAALGNNLGKVLMETFRIFMEHYASPVAVHYVGYDPNNKEDFSKAMYFQNRIESQAGVHSMTFELKTEAHTDD